MPNLLIFSGNSSDKLLDEFKISLSGEVFTSIRGAARLAGVDEKALRVAFQGAEQKPSKLAQSLISKGFESAEQVKFSESGIPELAVTAIVFYYAYKARQYCNQTAERNAELISAIGLRSLVQKSLSWQPQQEPKSAIELLEMHLQIAKAHDQRLTAIEAENRMLKEQLEIVEMETIANAAELERFRNGQGHWFSIVAWCKLKGLGSKSLKELNLLGRKAAAMCRQRGIVPQKMPDPRFGTVGLYPDVVLEELF